MKRASPNNFIFFKEIFIRMHTISSVKVSLSFHISSLLILSANVLLPIILHVPCKYVYTLSDQLILSICSMVYTVVPPVNIRTFIVRFNYIYCLVSRRT